MAVPKKRTSKSKSKSRKANWKHKASFQSQKALSLAKSLLKGKNSSFIYIEDNNISDNT
uniref:ribosomal protein L32 n=1 Tax=Hypnea nidifica TaxID=673448 RepID=UPI0027DA21FF|nr:ribosomal protein L32 [Hypnea nidifica]WCH54249.1 ribosomal protein L32 [Hypnea nidifica]